MQERPTAISSSWANNSTHPATLFQSSTSTSAPGYGPLGLLNGTFGVTTYPSGVVAVHRAYDARGRVVSEVDTPTSDTNTASDSVGSFTVSGTEQSRTSPAKPGSALLTVSGSDGTTTVCSYQTVCNQYACWQVPITPCPQVPNTGAITATFYTNEFTSNSATAGYANGSTDSTIASAMGSAINSSGAPVSAVVSGTTIQVSATTTGPQTDYPFTLSNTGGGYTFGTNVPYGSAFAQLVGGEVANPVDSGTISVTVAGNVTTVPYGSTSTPTNLATALAASINAQDSGFVTATSSGATVTLYSTVGGSAADWNLSQSVTYDSYDFTAPSFTVTPASMTGGVNMSGALYSYVMPLNGGYDKNGNLLSVTDSVMGQWTYSYDNLNRLVNAQAPTSQPSGVNAYYAGVQTTWGYDAFGNRLSETQAAIPGASPTASMPTSSTSTYTAGLNQLATSTMASAITYDAAGDITYDGTNYYLYDAEGRICAVKNSSNALTGYVYDASGIRVAKGTLTRFTCDFNPADSATTYNGYATTTSWVLGPGGEQVTEYSVSGATQTWVHTNAFDGGKLLASYHDTDTYFALNDWLGTKRMEISAGGLTATFRSLPYGNGLADSGSATDATEQHFTGKERDAESGLDYFGARYYASPMGRFLSPDWSAKVEPVPYAKLDNPQSLNLYAYVGNNPLGRIDADGHLTIIVPGTWNNHKDWDNSGFKAQVSKTFGEKAVVLNNGGMDNTPQARAAAAKQLESLIAGHEFAPGEKLNIVTHSHGGNVAAEATQEGLSHKVDTLVTLGVPVRSDYTFNESVIGQHLNVFSNNDSVQPMGGRETTAWSPWGGNVSYAQPADRTVNLPGVRNLDATSTASGHSDLWQSPGTWDKIVAPVIK